MFIFFDNHLLLGDLNYDMLSATKSKTLTDIMELFDYKNLIKEATCFKKDCIPTLNDVILTNISRLCIKRVKIVPKALSGAIARHSGDGKFYAMPHNEALVGG